MIAALLIAVLAAIVRGSNAAIDSMPGGPLPRDVRPLGYDLNLRVDMDGRRVEGRVEIAIGVVGNRASDIANVFACRAYSEDGKVHGKAKPNTKLVEAPGRSTLRMHGAGLFIERVMLERDGMTIQTHWTQPDVNTEELTIELITKNLLPTGLSRYVLTILFSAPLDSASAFVRVHAGLAHTRFDPLGARGAFPCFDEPGFEAPLRLVLDVPANLRAWANARAECEDVVGGRRRVVFNRTHALPTRLMGWVVADAVELELDMPHGELYVPVRASPEDPEPERVHVDAMPVRVFVPREGFCEGGALSEEVAAHEKIRLANAVFAAHTAQRVLAYVRGNFSRDHFAGSNRASSLLESHSTDPLEVSFKRSAHSADASHDWGVCNTLETDVNNLGRRDSSCTPGAGDTCGSLASSVDAFKQSRDATRHDELLLFALENSWSTGARTDGIVAYGWALIAPLNMRVALSPQGNRNVSEVADTDPATRRARLRLQHEVAIAAVRQAPHIFDALGSWDDLWLALALPAYVAAAVTPGGLERFVLEAQPDALMECEATKAANAVLAQRIRVPCKEVPRLPLRALESKGVALLRMLESLVHAYLVSKENSAHSLDSTEDCGAKEQQRMHMASLKRSDSFSTRSDCDWLVPVLHTLLGAKHKSDRPGCSSLALTAADVAMAVDINFFFDSAGRVQRTAQALVRAWVQQPGTALVRVPVVRVSEWPIDVRLQLGTAVVGRHRVDTGVRESHAVAERNVDIAQIFESRTGTRRTLLGHSFYGRPEDAAAGDADDGEDATPMTYVQRAMQWLRDEKEALWEQCTAPWPVGRAGIRRVPSGYTPDGSLWDVRVSTRRLLSRRENRSGRGISEDRYTSMAYRTGVEQPAYDGLLRAVEGDKGKTKIPGEAEEDSSESEFSISDIWGCDDVTDAFRKGDSADIFEVFSSDAKSAAGKDCLEGSVRRLRKSLAHGESDYLSAVSPHGTYLDVLHTVRVSTPAMSDGARLSRDDDPPATVELLRRALAAECAQRMQFRDRRSASAPTNLDALGLPNISNEPDKRRALTPTPGMSRSHEKYAALRTFLSERTLAKQAVESKAAAKSLNDSKKGTLFKGVSASLSRLKMGKPNDSASSRSLGGPMPGVREEKKKANPIPSETKQQEEGTADALLSWVSENDVSSLDYAVDLLALAFGRLHFAMDDRVQDVFFERVLGPASRVSLHGRMHVVSSAVALWRSGIYPLSTLLVVLTSVAKRRDIPMWRLVAGAIEAVFAEGPGGHVRAALHSVVCDYFVTPYLGELFSFEDDDGGDGGECAENTCAQISSSDRHDASTDSGRSAGALERKERRPLSNQSGIFGIAGTLLPGEAGYDRVSGNAQRNGESLPAINGRSRPRAGMSTERAAEAVDETKKCDEEKTNGSSERTVSVDRSVARSGSSSRDTSLPPAKVHDSALRTVALRLGMIAGHPVVVQRALAAFERIIASGALEEGVPRATFFERITGRGRDRSGRRDITPEQSIVLQIAVRFGPQDTFDRLLAPVASEYWRMLLRVWTRRLPLYMTDRRLARLAALREGASASTERTDVLARYEVHSRVDIVRLFWSRVLEVLTPEAVISILSERIVYVMLFVYVLVLPALLKGAPSWLDTTSPESANESDIDRIIRILSGQAQSLLVTAVASTFSIAIVMFVLEIIFRAPPALRSVMRRLTETNLDIAVHAYRAHRRGRVPFGTRVQHAAEIFPGVDAEFVHVAPRETGWATLNVSRSSESSSESSTEGIES